MLEEQLLLESFPLLLYLDCLLTLTLHLRLPESLRFNPSRGIGRERTRKEGEDEEEEEEGGRARGRRERMRKEGEDEEEDEEGGGGEGEREGTWRKSGKGGRGKIK